MSRRAVFLDRDGVVNPYVYNVEFGTIDSPANPDEYVLSPGAGEAIAKLNQAGLLVVIVSNQPGIAKGRFSSKLLQSVTDKMERLVKQAGGHVDGVYYCPHHPNGNIKSYRLECECRKPRPGLFYRAARELAIDLDRSYTVGDGIVDVLAGREAGTRTFFVGPWKEYVIGELERRNAWPHRVVADLSEAVELIRLTENERDDSDSRERQTDNLGKQAHYANQYVQEAIGILRMIDPASVEKMADLLLGLRNRQGRLFLLGVGGGAGHASHAACDFRKIASIEAYSVSDNVSELTARVNDEGWETSYLNWLRASRLNANDMLFVFSVGGGDVSKNVSSNLVRALEYAKQVGSIICGVVGRTGGFTREVADACTVIPTINPATVTPHTESFQALIWHLLVSHPKLKAAEMKWESLSQTGVQSSPQFSK